MKQEVASHLSKFFTKAAKIGGKHSKRHSRRTEEGRSSRVAAVSRVSDMKRAAEDQMDSDIGESSPESGESSTNMNPSPPQKRLCSNDTVGTVETPTALYARMKIDTILDSNQERIAILDFGAQYGKVIDRRIREKNVLSEMMPLSTTAEEILSRKTIRGIVISGGPASVYAEGSPQIDPAIFNCGIPVLGICYGFQLMNKYNDGSVTKGIHRSDGQLSINIVPECSLFDGLDPIEQVLLTHGDCVTPETVAPGFQIVGDSAGIIAAIANEGRKLYGVQFHPETDLTPKGNEIFRNFIFKICGCKGDYTMQSREEMCITEITNIVGDKKVLVMVSGGVDSAVCAALLHKALGKDRITAIHIDTGFMRENESDDVIKSLEALNMDVYCERRAITFFGGTVDGTTDQKRITLDQTTDPEEKRQIIGNTFIRVKDYVMEKLNLDPNEYFLAQGTLRPDLIESASALASGHADKIKTHHNDTELVRKLRDEGRVIEPLKDFHKDEVRELGRSLGLPDDIVQRQPFPGPGLAIRIICAKQPFICKDFKYIQDRLQVLTNIHNKDIDDLELKRYREDVENLYIKFGFKELLNQGFDISTTLLPIKSVGVQGDCRSYSYVAVLSTAQRPIPWDFLEQYARILPKILVNINRVCYMFGKPCEHPVYSVTTTYLNRGTTAILRKADFIATNILFGKSADGKKDLDNPRTPNHGNDIQQMPVIMIPCHFDRDPVKQPSSYSWSFVLRPFITNDFMTGIAAIPGKHITTETVELMAKEIDDGILRCSRVLYDLTSKPPGTTEWE